MLPNRERALLEIKTAAEMNPGPWEKHSENVARAAMLIAEKCSMDAEKAYILGLLHDIGRRAGVHGVRHIMDGYDFCMENGWDEAARICLTHSYPLKDVDTEIGKFDITDEQYEFVKNFLTSIEFDDYDRLIILCDSLADANGFCILEKRFVDTTVRYGVFPFTVDRWKKTFEIKKYFESKANCSIYRLLPGIEECIYV